MNDNTFPSSSNKGIGFRTKFILVAVFSVLLALILSSTVALFNIVKLGEDATTKIEQGLSDASREYLENYIETTSLRINLILKQAFDEVTMLGALMQWLIDHPEASKTMGNTFSQVSPLKDNLAYNAKVNWWQSQEAGPSVVSVWGHCLLENGQIKPDIAEHIKNTTILNYVLPALKKNGADKLYMYMVAPRGKSYLRLTPYRDMASYFDRLYPGHNKKDFWDFFFPGIVDSWLNWPKSGVEKKDLAARVTLTQPYLDAAGGGIIVSCFLPVWENNYTDFGGAAATDFSLSQIVNLTQGVKLAQTGFAFIAQSQGNVLAVNGDGEKVLGVTLKTKSEEGRSAEEGVNLLDRNLNNSSQAGIRSLKLPEDDDIHMYSNINLDVPGGWSEKHVIVMKRMPSILTYTGNEIKPQSWVLGFVVPANEIYNALIETKKSLGNTVSNTIISQIFVALASLLLVMLGVLWVAKHMTSGLVSLAKAAGKIKDKDYTVRVNIETRDEISQLGDAFNAMTEEIEQYTSNLENMVKQRTQELVEANKEIHALNKILKAENVRLGAEMEVAQQLQMMVLPKSQELESVAKLEISGYMSPADEVGGDYYDVLQAGSLIKIGIGDVTGHGLRSGVIMLMVQSITQTLLESGLYDPIRFLILLNHVLYKNIKRIDTDRNLTLSFIDYTDGEITISGQHEQVILVKKDGQLNLIDTIDLGFPIGLEPDVSNFIATESFKLEKNELVVLYTDGVTEAENMDNVQYGMDRFCESILKRRSESAEMIKNGIVEDVINFIGKQTIYDDISVVVIKGK